MESSPTSTLTVQDRCDSCGSRAYIRAVFPGTGNDLCFCGHHGAQHRSALESAGAIITDETSLLTAW